MADVDISKIEVTGKWIETKQTLTGKKCLLLIKHPDLSKSKLKEGLNFSLEGPTKSDVLFSHVADSDVDEQTLVAYFVPVKTGTYKLAARFMGRKLNQATLNIEAVGDDLDVTTLLSKVSVHGRAIELGKAFSHNDFVVDCSQVQPPLGNLKVHVKGPERASAHLNIIDNENGTFTIRYKPTSPGMYIVTIKIADTDIPGSPFQIRVTEFLSS